MAHACLYMSLSRSIPRRFAFVQWLMRNSTWIYENIFSFFLMQCFATGKMQRFGESERVGRIISFTWSGCTMVHHGAPVFEPGRSHCGRRNVPTHGPWIMNDIMILLSNIISYHIVDIVYCITMFMFVYPLLQSIFSSCIIYYLIGTSRSMGIGSGKL